MNGKPDVGSNGIIREEVFRFELEAGVYLEINLGIAYSGIPIGPPKPPRQSERLITWSIHPVGIDKVGVLQITEHGR